MDCGRLTSYLSEIHRLNKDIGDLGNDFEANIAQTAKDNIDQIIKTLVIEMESTDEKYLTIEQVDKLFGDNFIGPDTVDGFLGKESFFRRETRMPEFSRFTLIRARHEGARLIWRRQKKSNNEAIGKITDLQEDFGQAAERKGLGLEIKNMELVKFVNYMMAQGWAIVYDQGNEHSYYEDYINHDEFISEKQVDTASLRERLENYHETKQKISELLQSKEKKDEAEDLLDRDQIDGVMRPSVIEMFYDLIAILAKTGSVPLGEFWTSTMLSDCKMATIKTEMSNNKLTVTFGERYIMEKGPVSAINRTDTFEKFKQLLDRDKEKR